MTNGTKQESAGNSLLDFSSGTSYLLLTTRGGEIGGVLFDDGRKDMPMDVYVGAILVFLGALLLKIPCWSGIFNSFDFVVRACSAKKRDKNGNLLWFLPHTFFFDFLRIFVPILEILFRINYYFLVYISKYRTSLRINSRLEIQRNYFFSNNLYINSTKNRTVATTTAEGNCVLVCAFIGHS